MTDNNSFGLHAKSHGNSIWKRRYKSPLAQTKAEYELAAQMLRAILVSWPAYTQYYFGNTDAVRDPFEELEDKKKCFVEKTLTYASTLFSAINSWPGLIPSSRMDKLRELRLVMAELGKFDSKYFSSSNKEAMIGCLNLLEHGLPEAEGSRDYYRAVATKFVFEVLDDVNAPLATRMLTNARAIEMSSFADSMREKCRKEVLGLLSEIRADTTKIHCLAQEWKTYVRLARLVYSWKHMFFGLCFDWSMDLHIKSYLFFVRYCYK